MKSLFGKVAAVGLGVVAIAVLLSGVFLVGRILLVPFVAALFVAYLFEPGVSMFERRGIDRGNAYLILLGLSALGFGTLVAYAPAWIRPEAPTKPAVETLSPPPETPESQSGASPAADGGKNGAKGKGKAAGKAGTSGAAPKAQVKVEVPTVSPEEQEAFTDRITQQLNQAEKWVMRKAPMLASMHLAEEVSLRSVAVAKRLFEELPSLITSFTVNLLLVPFIAYFMVRDGRRMKRRVIEWVPNRYFEMSLLVFEKVDGQIGGYLRGRLIECILVGVTQMVVMGIIDAFFDVPQPQILLIAVVCGLTNVIPYVGPVLGSAFGVFLYLGAGASFVSCGGFLAAVAVTHVLDNIVIAPAVLSHNVDLHPLAVALVLVIGGELMGVLGLLIAIPVAASIKVIVSEFQKNYRAQAR